MEFRNYEVRFNVDGRFGGSLIVEAINPTQARNNAKYEIESQLAYSGKKIQIIGVRPM